ncbi:hypothetical protein FI667_g5927, partial [Globisporangium splendens]
MCALVQPPPYMLGERPTPLHGGTGQPTFRQVPFVRVSERVESGVRVRKQLRKYLKASSATQHMVAQMHLSDACITAMQPQEIAQSSFESFFTQMKHYNATVGQKHLEASKAYLEMTKPLDNSGKSKKWARDAYNAVQKSVQDVNFAEKKMEKAKLRKERAEDELVHWKKVLEANEATYQVQPNNPEVVRAFQLAQYRFANAFAEDEAATYEYEDARNSLYSSIERRDQVVEEATELSQSMEEDRLDTMLIVMNQFVETKVAILQAEIEAMSRMQKMLREMDRDSVIQQYVVDCMQPELTHRHAKALYLMEWHRHWHYEQSIAIAKEPSNYLTLTPDDMFKVKEAGISPNDIEIIKDFIGSCFVEPDALLQAGKSTSTRHRNRFTDPTALAMYRMAIVRKTILDCLNQQRTHGLELSKLGYDQLAAALQLLLDACSESEDTKTVKNVMNMIQTFYRKGSVECQKVYLHASLSEHSIWSFPQYWGNALLVSIGEELSKNPQEIPWHMLPNQERAQVVLHVHNIVFGQLTAFIYHMATFGFSRKQILQYAQNVCFAYELGEDQRMNVISSVQSLQLDEREPRHEPESDDAVQFTSLTLSDWTNLCGGALSGQKFRPFLRSRTQSTISDAVTVRSLEGSIVSMASLSSSGVTASGVRDLEEMKSLASVSSTKISSSGSNEEESWEDLFGSASSNAGGGVNGVFNGNDKSAASNEEESNVGQETEVEKHKRMKKRKNSRKFNDQLRLARSLPLSYRIGDEPEPTTGAAATREMPLPASNGSSQKAGVSAGVLPPKIDEHVADDTRASHSGSARQSVDDGIYTTQTLEKKRSFSSKRMHKSRSAASIDTSSLKDPTTLLEHSGISPQVSAEQQLHAPPPLPPTTPTKVKVAVARATSTGGMDQIKSIAAQMKQRRKAAEKAPSFNDGAFTTGVPHESPSQSKSLRRTQSGTAATFHTLPPRSNEHHNGDLSTVPPPSAGHDVEEEKPTGFAAIRARFEKI